MREVLDETATPSRELLVDGGSRVIGIFGLVLELRVAQMMSGVGRLAEQVEVEEGPFRPSTSLRSLPPSSAGSDR